MFLAVVLSLCMLFVCGASAQAEAPYAEQLTTVYKMGEEAGALTLRFYEETPHVPYLGMRAYSEYMWDRPLTFRENGDGTCALVNEIGAELLCDPEAETITVPNWARFFDLPLPLEDVAKGWKDTNTHFARITNVEYEGEASPVMLDFAKYGIRIYADGNDIYLPVSTLSNIMTDIATNHLRYNGENLYAAQISLTGEAPEGLYASEKMQAELQGQERPEDVVRQCYADICFTFDTFFGHPGRAEMDGELAEKGLDQLLTELEENGDPTRKGLLSTDLTEYLCAVDRLFMRCLNDGHTMFIGLAELAGDPVFDRSSLPAEHLVSAYYAYMMNSPMAIKQIMHVTIPMQRAMIWGDEDYREYGNTAIIRLDDFMPDEEAWADYYKGEGELPQDPLGIVISGLRRASENPEIENVIFDLSGNGGGSPDTMMLILGMTTGQTHLNGLHKLTGQRMTFTFEADTNLDGVFDDRDKETRYDFNYGVLVTRHAFSCGNLLPIVMQEGGAVLIGEPSSGGSCCVQMGSDIEGFSYMMSSAQWQLCDAQYNPIEGGCRIDLPIEAVSDGMFDFLAAILGLELDEDLPSFAEYFDDARLDEMMNDWFAVELDLAA